MDYQSFMTNYGSLIMLVLVFVVFYFILIRPQKKKEKELRETINKLKVGDKVVTIGGISGKISELKDDTVVLETGALNNRSSLTVSRWAIKECLTIKE